MDEKQRVIQRISISPGTPIRSAMGVMTRAPKREAAAPAGMVFVVDGKRRLLGIATDGDIRRAIERGVSLEHPISEAMNSRPFLIEGPRSNAEILSVLLEKIKREGWRRDRIRYAVLVDSLRRVTDIIPFFDLWRNSEVRFKHVGVIGLGYVGLTLALTLADRGFQVRGFDTDPKVRRLLRRGRPHFFEIGLSELLRDTLGRTFEIHNRLTRADACDLYVIAVGTPVDSRGEPQFKHIEQAAAEVGKILKQGDAVILRSTVPVGTTRGVAIPILERFSRLTAGKDFYIAFAPERTVEGKALEELRRLPQVVGGIDRASAEVAEHLFNAFTSYSIVVDSLEEAEMVKLVNNAYRDVTFAFANELSLICRRWGIDTRRVIDAANRDYDRGRVPLPSPGVGGYCLKKDPYIFIASAKKKGASSGLSRRAREVSDAMVQFVANEVLSFLRRTGKPLRRAKVLLIGVAFKGEPATSDIRGSTSLDLVALLKPRVGHVVGYDPAVDPADFRKSGLARASSIRDGVSAADAIVVMHTNPAFRALGMRRLLASARRPALLFDAWGLYMPEEIAKVKGVEYRRL